ADHDSNDLDDLLDYALGHGPGETDGLPVLSVADGTVTFSYTENLAADDVRLSVEWSTDLLDWQPLGSEFDLVSLTPGEGGRRTVTYASNPGLFTTGEHFFIRLRTGS
ncbi:MAG: hypothetical protein GWO24_20945, partial [Akkermansiaceae bacterium]|nr:hypothetical protein [Akkermansiaceae bacterium]